MGPRIWNDLSIRLRKETDINMFKSLLKCVYLVYHMDNNHINPSHIMMHELILIVTCFQSLPLF